MKIIYFLTCLFPWKSGCWLYRCRIPQVELKARGHEIQFILPGKEMAQKWLDYPDVVVFGVYGGLYNFDIVPLMKKYKELGKKVIYDLDDDIFTINPDNPSKAQAKKQEKKAKECLREADAITTTTKVLQKKFRKYNKNVIVCPNALDFSKFPEEEYENKKLKIGYTGAASHWGDLSLVLDVLLKLQKKHDFLFVLQGMCGRPIVAEIYNYQMILKQELEPEKKHFFEASLKTYEKLKKLNYIHIPFYPPELYPSVLGQLNLDIGICPLKNNEFNHSKSCIKFYEYATVGTATLASKVLPYKREVGYCAKNTSSDWYNKLEKLIIDKKFRQKLLAKQQKFVREHNDIKEIIKKWEKTFKK